MPQFGIRQIALVLVILIVLIFIGKLPKVASAFGKTLKSYQSGIASKNRTKTNASADDDQEGYDEEVDIVKKEVLELTYNDKNWRKPL